MVSNTSINDIKVGLPFPSKNHFFNNFYWRNESGHFTYTDDNIDVYFYPDNAVTNKKI